MTGPDPVNDDLVQLRRLRLAALLEGGTLIALLFVAVPAKYLLGFPLATKVMGPLHGLAFLVYLWTLVATVSGGGWRAGEVVRMATAALVPFGALATAGLLRCKEATLLASG